MAPRIAIPVPHSGDRAYAERVLPQYEEAVRLAGGEPVRIELDQTPAEIAKQAESCHAVLLPGSRADVDPQKYREERHAKTADSDRKRDMVDDVLLQHAYRERKPVLGICYGLQSLNVHCSGTLVQHIESEIKHAAGRAVAHAHEVKIDPQSRLAKIIGVKDGEAIGVNSSHHQSAQEAGKDLRIVAYSASDGIVEALEGTDPDHFVLAVQWHPERSVHEPPQLSDSARAIFEAFIQAAEAKRRSSAG
jgi:putative glutamine amidotransferase